MKTLCTLLRLLKLCFLYSKGAVCLLKAYSLHVIYFWTLMKWHAVGMASKLPEYLQHDESQKHGWNLASGKQGIGKSWTDRFPLLCSSMNFRKLSFSFLTFQTTPVCWVNTFTPWPAKSHLTFCEAVPTVSLCFFPCLIWLFPQSHYPWFVFSKYRSSTFNPSSLSFLSRPRLISQILYSFT